MHTARISSMTLALATASSAWSIHAATLDDIQFWTGNGTNRAALVIDWGDAKSPQSLLWGYRWDGAATGLDMLQTVITADARLFGYWGQFSWGTAIFGLGYDLNDSGSFGVEPPLAFGPGGLLVELGSDNADDTRQPSDVSDHYHEGWNNGFWAYYLKSSAAEDWASAMSGGDGRALTDGAWDGYRFAPNFSSTAPAEPSPALPNPFALEVVASQGPFGASPYDDPSAVLGRPSTDFFDPLGESNGGTTERRVKLVEAAYNLDVTQSHQLITTLQQGSSIIVRFEQPIRDNPAHPYGIDLLVFGNANYASSGFVTDSSDLNSLMLAGGGFFEPTKVSVSPGYTGKPGQDPTDWQTWDWYRYDTGPFADSAFPTQAYAWDRATSTWNSELMDFTKPVNPTLNTRLNSGNTSPLSAADAIEFYDGSGGGTGFDLAESGFTAVQYVMVEGLPDYSGGEIDAFSSVRPVQLGDSLTLTPDNLTDGTATLHFQRPNRLAETALALDFTAVSDRARIATTALPDPSAPAAYGRVITAAGFEVSPLPGSDPVVFAAALRLSAGTAYPGSGQDLLLFQQTETDWEETAFTFDAANRSVVVPDVTTASTFALVQVLPPRITLALGVDGLGEPLTTLGFTALAGWTYTLDRTSDLLHWVEVTSQTPSAPGWTELTDGAVSENAYYRVRLHRP